MNPALMTYTAPSSVAATHGWAVTLIVIAGILWLVVLGLSWLGDDPQ
jgi:hypothetical protein